MDVDDNKQINKYPYNVKKNDTKVYLSQRVCSFLAFSFSNNKKKKILSCILILCLLFGRNNKKTIDILSHIKKDQITLHDPLITRSFDKVKFIQTNRLPLSVYYLNNERITNPSINALLNSIRGGNNIDFLTMVIGNLVLAVFLIVGYRFLILEGAPDPTFVSPGWNLPVYEANGSQTGKASIKSTLKMKPYKNLQNRWIVMRSKPNLVIPRTLIIKPKNGFIKKTGLHINSNSNPNTYHDMLREMVENPNSMFLEKYDYGRSTFKFIVVYNDIYDKCAIFEQVTGQFITVMPVNNFHNLNIVNMVDRTHMKGQNDGFTPINSFETDVVDVVPHMKGQNDGFTPINSFETDILDVLPKVSND